jgi:amino acid transporter
MYAHALARSGFAVAFRDRGYEWAYDATAAGELVSLPLVVLVSFIAQPRLLYAMADDGLLPSLFREVCGTLPTLVYRSRVHGLCRAGDGGCWARTDV